MLKRTLFFSTPWNLSLKDNQLVMSLKEAPEQKKTVPIEDIGFVVLEHPTANVTLPLLNALAAQGAAVIVCDNHMPNAMLLSLHANSTLSEVYRIQIEATEPLKKNLWKQTVEAKILNQARLLDKLGKNGDRLKPYYNSVKSGDANNREGVAAKLYWAELLGKEFVREREAGPPNQLLNYGYTILRAAITRAVMGSGLFPAFGILHRNRYNAFALADDLMDPYRPYVDEIVFHLHAEGETELTGEVKSKLLHILYTDTVFSNIMRPLDIGLSITTASVVKCFAGKQKKILYPLFK